MDLDFTQVDASSFFVPRGGSGIMKADLVAVFDLPAPFLEAPLPYREIVLLLLDYRAVREDVEARLRTPFSVGEMVPLQDNLLSCQMRSPAGQRLGEVMFPYEAMEVPDERLRNVVRVQEGLQDLPRRGGCADEGGVHGHFPSMCFCN